jgi:hypothetical protein
VRHFRKLAYVRGMSPLPLKNEIEGDATTLGVSFSGFTNSLTGSRGRVDPKQDLSMAAGRGSLANGGFDVV